MLEIINGITDGQKWLMGTIPMKQNLTLYVNTKTGDGVQDILDYLEDFIKYQAAHITLPSYSNDDIIQELNMIAMLAIPDYDAGKQANMLTFLQNHIKNRIINIYKYSTEKCRTATHDNFRFCKVRCPKCKNFSIIDESTTILTRCYTCGNKKKAAESWRKYPVPIPFISSNEEFTVQDGSQTTIQEHCSYEDVAILNGQESVELEELVLKRLSIYNILDSLDIITQQIIKLFLAGYSFVEISKQLDISTQIIKAKFLMLAKNPAFVELNV